MKKVTNTLTGLVVALCLMLMAESAWAEQNGPKFKLGVGTYALIIADDDSTALSRGDDELYGGALVGTVSFTKHVAVRGTYYAIEHDDFSAIDVKGGDVQLLIGTNFYEGFNVFGGIGAFSETWEVDTNLTLAGVSIKADKSFTGAQASFGIGYSWSRVALDFVVNARDTKKYEDFSGLKHDYAFSGGTTISYIF